MPPNRLSVLFDKKLKHSRSASTLAEPYYEPVYQDRARQQTEHAQNRHTRVPDTIMQEYTFGRPIPAASKSKAPSWPRDSPSQLRASTTPLIDPPDELFLKLIRRRSAAALLEEMRIKTQRENDPDMDMRLAFASALPPSYLDFPPEYQSPIKQDQGYLPYQRPSTAHPLPHHDLADNYLKLQIDETIAQFSSIKVTGPTPANAPKDLSLIVSPLNDLDHIYLERRKIKKKQERSDIRDQARYQCV